MKRGHENYPDKQGNEKSKTVLFVEVESRTVVTRGYGMWGIREMLVKRYIISFMQGEEFLKISCTA